MASILADRIEAFAEGIRSRIGIDSVADELRVHAADVRIAMESYEREYQLLRVRIADLEAREQARLSERAYSASPTGCGELKPGECRVTYERGGGGLHPDAIIHPVTGTNVMPGTAAVIDPKCEE